MAKAPDREVGAFSFSEPKGARQTSDRSRHGAGGAGARRCRVHLRLPRRRQPADLPAPPRAPAAQAHPGPPRAGGGAYGRRLRPRLRQARRPVRALGPGRPEPGYGLKGHVVMDGARQAAHGLARAERPVILAGHGVLLSHAERELMQLAEAAAAPVGTTLLGIGAFPVKHPLSLHMTGFMGTGWCLKAVQNADVLMMVGMRVDDRVTAKLSEFAPNVKTFIHVDIDESEMGKNVRPHIELVADARLALESMLPHVDKLQADPGSWLAQIDDCPPCAPLAC